MLDRTKEPGAPGEPLYLDVVSAVDRMWADKAYRKRPRPLIIGGRYGLSSKEFTPSMAAAVWEELKRDTPRHSFTIGIRDDVTRQSLDWSPKLIGEPDDVVRAVFYGLGSDGTVGANKNSVKIIGEHTDFLRARLLCVRFQEGRCRHQIPFATEPTPHSLDVPD